MPAYCDVALPVPLDAVFTYRVNGAEPVVGGRVLVPFRSERLPGVVVKLHDAPPPVAIKDVLNVLDAAPVLAPQLMKLAAWIADYYLAPIGEVFRAMLPLSAEVSRAKQYRITDDGLMALHAGATGGSSRRTRLTAEEQDAEYSVLDHLADRGPSREQALRSATGATRKLLEGMMRKRWIVREDVSRVRDAARTVKFATLASAEGKLNDNQRRLVETLAKAGGRLPWEEVLRLDVPRSSAEGLVRRGLIAIVEEPAGFEVSSLKRKPRVLELNAAQQEALARTTKAAGSGFSVSLLHGVTGSGKTAVYLAAMQHVLDSGRGALLLVPEIGLTPAAAAELAEAFGDQVAILHSALSDDERAEQWRRLRAGDARIAVGTRSAVFAPVRDLALIVVDEEHDSSYKQEETPRYHARDVAIMRGKLGGAAVVLGSATPAMESFHNARESKYALIQLRQRVEQRPLPEVEIVDMRAAFREAGSEQVVSQRLHAEIAARLERNEQTLVLLNRRGYAPVVLCRACGETVQCKNCAISMTHHLRKMRLECHYCGFTRGVPQTCPRCGSEYVQFLGAGSERLEELLHGLFPQARIARLDRDTVRGRNDFERVLNRMHAGEIDILVGTQMIAKGHDVHGVTLVGILGADHALGFPDFRAAERTFQLLTQVAGRAGRGTTPGKVILQTYFPDHYAIQYAAQHDYPGFFEKEIRFRRWMHYPPFTSVANVLVRSGKLDEALTITGAVGKWFEARRLPKVRVLGPAPAPIVRLKRDYRYHFLVKSESRQALNAALRSLVAFAAEKKISRGNLVVDVDAQSLL
ncbi:MAG TPA: primosomal protein N' [Terriglobales bacterium]|nr:primosomal protein N' [Terriglobales bacterium]